MKEWLREAGHILGHTLLEFLPVVAFLFLAFLLMEWMEHRMGDRTGRAIRRAGRFAPAVGALLGAVPQCGFSAAAAGLYAGRVISLGTLFAVFLSTSDEMVAIALTHVISGEIPVWHLLRVVGVKILIGCAVGFVVDLIFRRGRAAAGDAHDHIEEMCEHDGCGCGRGILRSALHHTLEVGGFILLVSLALNVAVHLIGEDRIAAFLMSRGFLTCFLAGLVGLIPNCAASCVVTELYLGGALTTGGLYAGLLTGAGVGTLTLFRVNRPHRQNGWILLALYVIGVGFGVLVDLLHLDVLGM